MLPRDTYQIHVLIVFGRNLVLVWVRSRAGRGRVPAGHGEASLLAQAAKIPAFNYKNLAMNHLRINLIMDIISNIFFGLIRKKSRGNGITKFNYCFGCK